MPERKRDIVVIAGIPFDNLDMNEVLAFVETAIAAGQPQLVATANVNFVVKAQHDPEFRDIVRRADVITADGMPILWAARLLGHPLKCRVTGSDMVPALLDLAARRDYSVFFLGGGEGVGEIVLQRLAMRYPTLRAFAHAPDFAPLHEMAHDAIVRVIKSRAPDMLFVSLGAGKAEKWINMHLAELKVPVCIGVGATIDFLAGRVRRAPLWMQRAGLEWLFRLAQEPGRLFGRYLGDALGFARAFAPQWAHGLTGRAATTGAPSARASMEPTRTVVTVSGRLDAASRDQLTQLALPSLERGDTVVLDMAGVTFLDSAGLGALVLLGKKALEHGTSLLAARPSQQARTSLRLARLGDFLPVVDALDEARAVPVAPPASGMTAIALADVSIAIALAGRLDALQAPSVQEALATRLEEHPGATEVRLDMSDVRFLDSSGINVLVRLHKRLAGEGRRLRISAASPVVRQTLAIARLDKYLSLEAEGGPHA